MKGGFVMAYKKINLSKFQFSENPISMNEALKDISPLKVPQDVIDGKRKMVISGAQKCEGNKVGIKINYV